MPLWGNTDANTAAPKYVGNLVNKAPTLANRDLLFGNTTVTGVFGGDAQETPATDGVTHPGWILRTVGTGGRAGRVFNETLVAMGSMTVDANDDVAFKDVTITITTQPANTAVVGANASSFTIAATTSPATTQTYQWYANTGAGFNALTNAGVYSGVTTPTLAISNSTGLTGVQYRVDVGAAGANTKTSRRAVLTVS